MISPSNIALVALAGLALVVGGCGGGTHKTTTSTPAATTAATTTATTRASHPKTHKPAARRTPPKTSSRSSAPTAAPPPDGLRAAAGYASYDACVSSCGGSVPASIRRPLHIPSSCLPSSSHRSAGMSVLGAGAVGPAQPATLAVNSFIGSGWLGARVTWIAASSYGGPILIRGREIGGPHAVGFGEGHVPVDELQLSAPVTSAGGAREWPSFTRLLSGGCYAYQVDGTSFSSVIVFRAG